MLGNNRNYRGTIDIKEKTIFIGVLIVFFLMILLWYNYIHRTAVLPSDKIFEQAFVEPLDSVTDLEGDHKLDYGFDYWIRFKSFAHMHLKNAQEFKPSVAEVGRRWFAEKWKNDYPLQDTAASYEYVQRTNHTVGKIVNEWFLINKKRHYYFYRYWGI